MDRNNNVLQLKNEIECCKKKIDKALIESSKEVINKLNNNMKEYNIGEKIYFKEETRPYRIMARNERFLVCTKPYNPKHTVQYTIVDLKENIRGTENLIFGMSFESEEDCEEALGRLTNGETEVSYRNRIELNVINK